MSEDNTQPEGQTSGFDKETAIATSRGVVADLLLTDHVPIVENGEPVLDDEGNVKTKPVPMFVAVRPEMNDSDGSLIIICADEVDSDEVVVHTVFSGYMKKSELFSAPATESGIVDTEGKPLTSNDEAPSKLVGLTGETLS